MDITANSGFATYLQKVYGTVAAGLLISAAITFLLSTSPDAAAMFYHTDAKHVVKFALLGWVALLLPLVLVFVIPIALAAEAPLVVVNGLYGVFCASFGVSLYAATSQYTGSSVGAALLITAGTFTGLSLTGLVIKTPLTGLKSFCTMGLWGLVIVGFGDLLFHFNFNQTVMAIIAIAVFAGLTVTDSQDIRERYESEGDTQMGVMLGAISLYLDAVNLFIRILQLVGVKNDD